MLAPSSIIVISDTHCGDHFGLYPVDGSLQLDEGSGYIPGHSQQKLWGHWREFCDDWVPTVTRGEPFILVVNGDTLDGVHHGSVTQFTHNLKDQRAVAREVLHPLVQRAAKYFHIRGTEAHSGKSGQDEEELAATLEAEADVNGHHARWELWLDFHGVLIHFRHHISVTGSSAYATTALSKEITETLAQAALMGKPAPQLIVRSHRHVPANSGRPGPIRGVQCVVTPGWQVTTPFARNMPGARQTLGEFGGVCIRVEDGEPIIKTWVRCVERPATEVVRG